MAAELVVLANFLVVAALLAVAASHRLARTLPGKRAALAGLRVMAFPGGLASGVLVTATIAGFTLN